MEDVSAYVERLVADQFDDEEDPAYRAAIAKQIKASEADIKAGRVTDAREAMRAIAKEKGIKLDR